jgi:hypothetical protein
MWMLKTRPVLLSSLGVEIRTLLCIAIRTHARGVAPLLLGVASTLWITLLALLGVKLLG